MALQELVERFHAAGIRRAQQHLREELVGIKGDRGEQAIESVRRQRGPRRCLTGLRPGPGMHSQSWPKCRPIPRRTTSVPMTKANLFMIGLALVAQPFRAAGSRPKGLRYMSISRGL